MISNRVSGKKRNRTDKEEDNGKKQRISSKAPKVSEVACASKEGEVVVVSVDLQTDAQDALKERYG
jgi:hypothetical protein